MNSKFRFLVAVIVVFTRVVLAQEAGGPTQLGGIRASDMSIQEAFEDLRLNAPLGEFTIGRTYSSLYDPGWAKDSWFNSAHWRSSLSTFAVRTHRHSYIGDDNTYIDDLISISISNAGGRSFQTEDLFGLATDAYTLPTVGDHRIIFKNDIVTLISDGQIYRYEFAEATGQF